MERALNVLRGRVTAIAAACGAFAALAAPAAAQDPGLVARGSVEQVQVTGAQPGEGVQLLRRGDVLKELPAGSLGGVVFRKVDPGKGYTVATAGASTPPVRVLTTRSKPPSTAIYDQQLADGYGYLTTRDGTELAINVHLPGPPENGPYPTLVEYSGYGYANPDGPQSGIQPIAELLGFAVVDVNMRGTGCSGGAFDFFEPLQALDGYDIVETVARQPWVQNDRVGMLGISYGGISQLFVAAEQPPSLAAITPLSVIDSTQTTLYPGGILNTGFALEWAVDRVEDSAPASPTTGQRWAWDRIEGGDEICKANQDLHPEAVNLIEKTKRNSYYFPKIADPIAPVKFVDQIEVPVFMACQWTDEQTGGHCPTLVRAMTGTDKKWFNFTNGTHTDSLDPETFNRWYDFLSLYVAGERPSLDPSLKAAASVVYSALMGVDGVSLPDDPIQEQPDFESALAAFEALPRVRILFDNGGGGRPGTPKPAFERSFRTFPPAKAKPQSWYLGRGGRLSRAGGGGGADQFMWDDSARPPTNFSGSTGSGTNGLWTATPSYDWTQNPPGTALSYVSGVLGANTAVLGAGELQVWVRSEARNVDLQATVSEVRPDGEETFVQGGWLRTGARKVVRAESTLTEPVPNLKRKAEQKLPKGRFVKVRIPLYYQGHVYRAGSRLRVTLSAPGGDQPIWAFAEAQPEATPWVAVAHTRKLASRLVLPVISKFETPTGLPPCPGLRGQPCRDYVPLENARFGKP